MSRHEALEARLRAHPDDQDSWRVYADWLLDRDDVRGELIQLQQRLQRRGSAEEQKEAKRRIRALEKEHRPSWLSGLELPRRWSLHWRSGFVTGVSLRWGPSSLQTLERLFAHPTARLLGYLHLAGGRIGSEDLRALADSPWLRSLTDEERKAAQARISALEKEHRKEWRQGLRLPTSWELQWRCGFVTGVRTSFWEPRDSRSLERLRAHPTGRLFSTLELPDGIFWSGEFASLLGEGTLRSVTRLGLMGSGIRDEEATLLAGSPDLCSLRRLDLTGNVVGPEGARTLAGSENLRSLTSLDLGNNLLGARGAEVLAASASLRSLTALRLRSNGLGEEGARALACSQSLRSLTALDLRDNCLLTEGTSALARSETLRSLVSLWLDDNQIGVRGARALAESSNLRSLVALSLMGNRIGDAGAGALARSEALGALTELDLTRNRIGDPGARALAGAGGTGALRSLRMLRLGENQIGDQGVEALARSERLRSLADIDLTGNPFSHVGYQALDRSETLRRRVIRHC